MRYTPLTTRDHRRVGTRERLLDVAERYPGPAVHRARRAGDRVLFDEAQRAVGVEYLKGERLYRAHAEPEPTPRRAARRRTRRREVILAGGAFNTPQLLMLSGIGPRAELERHGIPVRVDLPGVGRNLQDRYEVGVVNRMRFAHWEALADARFDARRSAAIAAWARGRDSLYATNGAGARRDHALDARRARCPTCSAWRCSARFAGYYPGYAAELAGSHNYLSWAILKAHTAEPRRHGRRCASADPRDPPRGRLPLFRGRQRRRRRRPRRRGRAASASCAA